MAYNNSTIRAAMSRSLRVGEIKPRDFNGHTVYVLGEIAQNGYYVLRFFGSRDATYQFYIELEILGSDISTIRSYLKNDNINNYEINGISAFDAYENYYTLSNGEYSLVDKSAAFNGSTTYYTKKGFNIYFVPCSDPINGDKIIIFLESSNAAHTLNNCELDIEYALKEFKEIPDDLFSVANIESFELGIDYYTMVGNNYVKVPDGAEFDSNATYFTKTSEFINRVGNFPASHLTGYFNTAHYESDVEFDGDASIAANRISTPSLVASNLTFATEDIQVNQSLSVGTLSVSHLHTDNFQTENITANTITTPSLKIGGWEIKPDNDSGDTIGIFYRQE